MSDKPRVPGGELFIVDISEYTDKEGPKRTSFRILADAYRLL